jgi:hypothetical protein
MAFVHLPKALRRRTMLKGIAGGASVLVGLPLLEAMLDRRGEALADGTNGAVRFVTWFFGNGFDPARWMPQGTGPGWTPSEELAPLTPHKAYVSVLTNFDNKCPMKITHHEGMTLFTGYPFVENVGLFSKAGGPSIDQVIAKAIKEKVAPSITFSSVQVGISRRLSVMDSGTTMHNLSHKGTNEPLPPEFNPQKVWSTLFGNFVPKNDGSGPRRVKVLDAVREHQKKLRERLGTKDRERLDAHLEGVDELQKQIQALPPVCDKPDMPTETNPEGAQIEPMTATNKAMSDLIAYAFACDLTRVASVLQHGGAAETVFKEIGQSSVHHDDSHNPGGALEEIHQGVVFCMEQFAYLLDKLKNTPDGPGGNLLDNSILFCGSDCSSGWDHSIFNQPMVIAGRGGGRLVHPGIHYSSASMENTTDVLLTFAQVFDPAIPSVGGDAPMSTTPFTKILA